MENENIKTSNGRNETINNSEILFIYECVTCNPNGDPDDENKPRMDYNSNRNLVSDVRLKRYIRDYLSNYEDQEIFVSKVDGETVDATNRLKKLIEANIEEIKSNDKLKNLLKGKKQEPDEKKLSEHLDWLLSKLIDVRMFGATMPIKSGDTNKGSSITFTGPIQFNWGYSLNKINNAMESNTITSAFAGKGEEYSTMGKDYRLAYSLIAFYGIISGKRADEQSKLSPEDIKLFDKAVVKAIPMEATTRSKIGQTPLFYLRVEYKGNDFFTGDFRKYIKITDKEEKEMNFDDTVILRSTNDFKLDLSKLKEKIRLEKVKSIIFWKNEDLELLGWDFNNNNSSEIIEFNPEDSKREK